MTICCADLEIIQEWNQAEAALLDLAVARQLLRYLSRQRKVTGYGLEIDPEENFNACIESASIVIETESLDMAAEQSSAIIPRQRAVTQALQAWHYPIRYWKRCTHRSRSNS